jgi:hypothetical protein
MNSYFIRDRQRGTAVVLALMAFAFSGCGAVRNPALERAREAYERALKEPEVARHAAVALDQTRLTLERAERLWETKQDTAEVDHLAYLTEKRAEIAYAIAKRRLAAEEIRQIRSQRE